LKLLLRASRSKTENYQQVFRAAKAVLFLGTPHSGSQFAQMGETLTAIARAAGFDTANQNLMALKPDSALLEGCREDFHALYSEGSFEMITFQEAKGMKGIGLAKLNDKVLKNSKSI
jgi:hypothetical protein